MVLSAFNVDNDLLKYKVRNRFVIVKNQNQHTLHTNWLELNSYLLAFNTFKDYKKQLKKIKKSKRVVLMYAIFTIISDRIFLFEMAKEWTICTLLI